MHKFSDIVDLDDEAMEDIVAREYALRFLDSTFFNTFITCMILLNTIAIGAETNLTWAILYVGVFRALDAVFITVFAMEILLKWYSNFAAFWRSGWNIFDFVLVAASVFAPGIYFIG